MSSSARITGSHLLAKTLQMEGVKNVFTLAGDHILPVLDVMSDQGFRFVDTRHEQAAVHMADAWGRITGQPGVAMYTTPGFANAIPGLTSALHAEGPVLSISGSASSKELGRGAMQEIDQIGMARPTTKGAWLVTDARRVPDMVAHALRVAFSGRRGPVHLTIPIDVQQQEVSEEDVTFYEPQEYRNTAGASAAPDKVQEAIALLRTASRPLVIAGTAAAYGEADDALRRLIETTRLPLMTEGDARGLVSDEHPYCFGFFDTALNRSAHLLPQADVVMLLGRKQDFIIQFAMPPAIAPGAKMIQVDPSAAEIGRNRGVAVGMVGDIATIVDQLANEAAKHTWADLEWLQQLQAERDAQSASLDSLAVAETPMHAIHVHKTLQQFLRPDDFLVFDGGDFCHFGRAFFPALKPKRWFYFPPLGMLGVGMPTALAAKLAYPDARVFMLTGDGSIGFNIMEFDTAVRHDLPIVGILGHDAAWGIDRQIQLAAYGKPVATDLLPTRYDQVVSGLGGYGVLVESPDELPSAIGQAIDSGRPALVNIAVQRAISPRAEAAATRLKREGVPSQ